MRTFRAPVLGFTGYGVTALAALFLLLSSLALAGWDRARGLANTRTFTGEIQDSACGGTARHVDSSCARLCVRNGAHWVLYDPSSEQIYQLDDQKRPAAYAAQTVIVTGTLDNANRTIHIKSMVLRFEQSETTPQPH